MTLVGVIVGSYGLTCSVSLGSSVSGDKSLYFYVSSAPSCFEY